MLRATLCHRSQDLCSANSQGYISAHKVIKHMPQVNMYSKVLEYLERVITSFLSGVQRLIKGPECSCPSCD